MTFLLVERLGWHNVCNLVLVPSRFPVVARPRSFAEQLRLRGIQFSRMLTREDQRRTIRSLQGWAISVLLEAGAIRECEEHGWMRDRADPHARERAFDIARQHPPPGFSSR